MKLFLSAGPETPDNLNCYRRIEYGLVEGRQFGPETILGLRVKGKDILLSDVMNVIENLELPAEVQEYFPDLTNQEWDAVTRMITTVLLSLECSDER
jgi:hypothetical protein